MRNRRFEQLKKGEWRKRVDSAKAVRNTFKEEHKAGKNTAAIFKPH